jgi:glutamyl-tRNA synthetase
MEITHVISGDDHLTNAARQTQLYQALGWETPVFAHIPLIHGPDGTKLSKRHGALGVAAYREMGFLPEAMRNYLLRLGWSHGDEEIIPDGQAIEWFDLDAIGRSPARFDMAKLTSLNAHYLREADDARLVRLIEPLIEKRRGRLLSDAEADRLRRGMSGLKQRAKTLPELADNALFYVAERPLEVAPKAAALLDAGDTRNTLADLASDLDQLEDWAEPSIEARVRAFAERRGLGLGKVAQPLRAALTGSTVSPGIFEVMAVLGKDEAVARVRDASRRKVDDNAGRINFSA